MIDIGKPAGLSPPGDARNRDPEASRDYLRRSTFARSRPYSNGEQEHGKEATQVPGRLLE